LSIDPTLIASRSTLSDLAYNWDKHAPELMNWQRELLNRQQPLTSPPHKQSLSDTPSRGSLE